MLLTQSTKTTTALLILTGVFSLVLTNQGLAVTPASQTNKAIVTPQAMTLPALKGKIVSVPAGSPLTVSLQQPVSTQINQVGDPIEALLETPLIAENNVVLPKGSLIKGTIVGIRSSGGAIRSGALELRFTVAQPLNTTLQLPLIAKVQTPNGSGVLEGEGFKSNAGQIATKTAIGAATGAVAGSLGGLLRHSNVGNGAIIGASIGAGIGLIQSLFQTKPQPVELENNAPLTLVLEQSFTVGGNTVPVQVVLPPYTPKSTASPTASSNKPTQVVIPPEGTGYYGY